jgi:hypothetical protein
MNQDIAWAWAAGIFEGEGTIVLSQKKRGGRLILKMGMTDLDVVQRWAQITNAKIYKPKPTPGQKQMWYAHIERSAVVRSTLQQMWPYLGCRRRARAVELGYSPDRLF